MLLVGLVCLGSLNHNNMNNVIEKLAGGTNHFTCCHLKAHRDFLAKHEKTTTLFSDQQEKARLLALPHLDTLSAIAIPIIFIYRQGTI